MTERNAVVQYYVFIIKKLANRHQSGEKRDLIIRECNQTLIDAKHEFGAALESQVEGWNCFYQELSGLHLATVAPQWHEIIAYTKRRICARKSDASFKLRNQS